jgi:hypothetical protein
MAVAADPGKLSAAMANISWPAQWPLSEGKASVWFDGTLVWKDAFKKGVNIRIPTTPGPHEMRIEVPWRSQKRYQINFPKPGTYNIELTWVVFPGNFADECKVYEVNAALQAQESSPIAATPSKLQDETPSLSASTPEQITNLPEVSEKPRSQPRDPMAVAADPGKLNATMAHVIWKGRGWALVDLSVSVYFDGALVQKASYNKGFIIPIPTTLGAHELGIKLPLRTQKKYQIRLPKPAAYKIEVKMDVLEINFADECKVTEIEPTGIATNKRR